MSRIRLSRKALSLAAVDWRAQGRRVVFTNGVFDILHRGHVELLEKAKSLGDVLVVGLNSNASARRLKGPGRPINCLADRVRVLGALKPVDHICIFSQDTPLELIKRLQPDVLVKGSEYSMEDIVGAQEVRSWGGLVKRFRMRPGYSTSALERRVSRGTTPGRLIRG